MTSGKTEAFLEKIRQKLAAEGNDDQDLNIAFLKRAIRSAEDLFNSSIWIFDTYTDHSIIHARNVVRIMYQLLSEMQILEQLNSLELTLCLLSAYYHDAGMFLTCEEKKRYLTESRQKRQRHRRRDIASDRDLTAEDPRELNNLQYYVRQNHGKFVSAKLQQVRESSKGALEWIWMENGNRYEIEKELAVICASHNELAEDLTGLLQKHLMGPRVKDVNYMLCCVALRIADLLDFDQTRTSQLRYHCAGLVSSHLTKEEQYSRDEMQKHMQSCGFDIYRIDKTLVFRISAQPRVGKF